MKIGSTLSKVTAVLCALVMLFGVIAFFNSDVSSAANYLNAQIQEKEDLILQAETLLASLDVQLGELRQEQKGLDEDLNAAKDAYYNAVQKVSTAQQALAQAEAKLDRVCSRSAYNSRYCKNGCLSLHTAVSTQKKVYSSAQDAVAACRDKKESIEMRISKVPNLITQVETNIENTKESIPVLEKEIDELKGDLVGVWLLTGSKALAMLLSLIGLGVLIKGLSSWMQDRLILVGVVLLAISSILFLIAGTINNWAFESAPLAYLLLSPHTWNIPIMWLFASILQNKASKPVASRNAAVVLAVILGLLSIANKAPAGVLYAVAMICAAFVIEPLVFTEYIDIAKHIFLTFITYGIWQLVWIYCVTRNLNHVQTVDSRRPARELLLCMFLPFYYPYWLYKTAEGVEDYGKEKGKAFKIDFLCILFAFICPLFATVLIQNKFNVIAGKPGLTKVAAPETHQ